MSIYVEIESQGVFVDVRSKRRNVKDSLSYIDGLKDGVMASIQVYEHLGSIDDKTRDAAISTAINTLLGVRLKKDSLIT